MNAKTLLFVSACFVLSGCGLTYETNRLKILGNETDAKYGPPPPPDYHLTEQKLLLAQLKDPEGVTFSFADAHQEVIAEGFIAPKVTAVWVSQVKSFSKNGSGTYSTPDLHLFAWKFGRIIARTRTVFSDLGDVPVWSEAAQ